MIEKKLSGMVKLIVLAIAIAFMPAFQMVEQNNKDKENFCVAINSRLYLFVGVFNPVQLTVANIPLNQLSFTCENGTVQTENGIKIKPQKIGMVELKAFRGNQLVAKMKFNAIRLPDPRACIAGERSYYISAPILLAASQLYIIPSDKSKYGYDIPYDKLFRITSFTFSCKVPDGFTMDLKSDSNEITSDMKRIIRTLSRGQKIYFEEILVQGIYGGETREIGTIMYVIK